MAFTKVYQTDIIKVRNYQSVMTERMVNQWK